MHKLLFSNNFSRCLSTAALAVLMLSAAGCSASYMQCMKWRAEGNMFSSLDSCKQCVNQLGSADVEVIKGCAVGVDLGKVVTVFTPSPAATPSLQR